MPYFGGVTGYLLNYGILLEHTESLYLELIPGYARDPFKTGMCRRCQFSLKEFGGNAIHTHGSRRAFVCVTKSYPTMPSESAEHLKPRSEHSIYCFSFFFFFLFLLSC